MKRKGLFVAGVLIFLLSYIPLLVPESSWSNLLLSAMAFLFMIGVIVICEWITLEIRGSSLIKTILKSKRDLILFFVISGLGGLFLDGIAKWLGKLWFYPYWDISFYFLFVIPGFAVYWLMITESYLAGKYTFDKLFKKRHIPTKDYSFERTLFNILGGAGALVVIYSLLHTLSGVIGGGSISFGEVGAQVHSYSIGFWTVIAFFFGLWFIFEFIEYRKRKGTLIRDTVHLYLSPVLSIIVSSLILAVVMETQNLPLGFWVYENFPLERVKVLGIPIMIFATWPLQYIAFLSLFRAFTGRESRHIWQGDLID